MDSRYCFWHRGHYYENKCSASGKYTIHRSFGQYMRSYVFTYIVEVAVLLYAKLLKFEILNDTNSRP
jgi:hypothetical protein